MGFFDRFRKRQVMDGADALGMGLADSDLPPGEGGPSLWARDMAELRWTAMQQAQEASARGTDPERWLPDGRLAENYERAVAHAHEGLRARAGSFVLERVRESVEELYDIAGYIAPVRDSLRRTDADLAELEAQRREVYAEVDGFEPERSRYRRLQSATGKYIKWLVVVLIVASEVLISGRVFDNRLEFDYSGMGYLFALGVITIFIVIPHYAAQGFKEGITQHHRHDLDAAQRDGGVASPELERSVHKELWEDRGFRIITIAVGLLLLGLTIPLSMLRAEGGFEGVLGVAFFVLVQLAISGYFFMREWSDHGSASHTLLRLDERRERLLDVRATIVADLSQAMSDFFKATEGLATVLRQAPRWDAHIVQTHQETLRYGRHLVAKECKEDEQFIYWARTPYLGPAPGLDAAGYPLDPISNEHLTLEESGPFGRDWWLRQSVLRMSDGSEPRDWYLAPNPEQLLRDFLRMVADVPVDYDADAPVEAPADTEHPHRMRVVGQANLPWAQSKDPSEG